MQLAQAAAARALGAHVPKDGAALPLGKRNMSPVCPALSCHHTPHQKWSEFMPKRGRGAQRSQLVLRQRHTSLVPHGGRKSSVCMLTVFGGIFCHQAHSFLREQL